MTKSATPKPWDGIISRDEERAYNAAGFGRTSGLGKRPALLIIDVQYRTVGTTPKPFWEAIKEFPTACGDVGWAAVPTLQNFWDIFGSGTGPSSLRTSRRKRVSIMDGCRKRYRL